MIITKTSSRRTINALTWMEVIMVVIFAITECCLGRGVGFIAIGKVKAMQPRNNVYSTASSTGPQTLFNHNQQQQRQVSICQHSSCHRLRKWHFALHMQLPHSQKEETSFESQNIQTNYCHHRRIVVVMPKYLTYIDESSRRIDDNGSSISSTSSWQLESSRLHLKQIASEYQLPILEEVHNNYETNMEQSINECYHDYTHYLTAVSYPRIASYAIAIGTINHNNQQRKKRKTKMSSSTDDAYFVDLCPPPDTGLGYRLRKNSRVVVGGGGGGGEELLLKALGMKKLFNSVDERRDDTPIIIYDLTAGLARDSLVILTSFLDHWDTVSSPSLWHGVTPQLKLHMIERDPIVALLLADAMRRLNVLADHDGLNESHSISDYVVTEDERCIAQKMQQCLSMEAGDGVTVLSQLMTTSITGDSADGISTQRPDICYLDPMFPPRKKQKSAVKKDMAMLHSLLGTAEEAVKRDEAIINADGDYHASGVFTEVERLNEEQALLLAACKVAKKRVVVKRPIGAKPLGLASSEGCDGASGDGHPSIINIEDIPKPSYDVRGSVNRFDVYLMT